MPDLAFNEHGQPHPHLNRKRRIDRGINELIGVCRGMLADGIVNEREAHYLNEWVNANPDLVVEWPVDAISDRLLQIYADGRVDEEERGDLAELLAQISGGYTDIWAGDFAAATLPLDQPPPEINFDGSCFVFTGKFALGPRHACEDITHQLGGRCEARVTKRTAYLVIGTFGSRDWANTSFGRKIEKAVEARTKWGRLRIVCEDHWAAHIG